MFRHPGGKNIPLVQRFFGTLGQGVELRRRPRFTRPLVALLLEVVGRVNLPVLRLGHVRAFHLGILQSDLVVSATATRCGPAMRGVVPHQLIQLLLF